MSQENVEVLRRANAAFNRGDIEGFLDFAVEDIEVEDLKHAPDFPPVAKGRRTPYVRRSSHGQRRSAAALPAKSWNTSMWTSTTSPAWSTTSARSPDQAWKLIQRC
jgi:ketosteroid isomerase-like protein